MNPTAEWLQAVNHIVDVHDQGIGALEPTLLDSDLRLATQPTNIVLAKNRHHSSARQKST